MEHPYGKQYGQEGNPRAYMTMRDYRNLPYQWGNKQPVERNPSEYMSMRDYRNLELQNQQSVGRNPNPNMSLREYRDKWMSTPVYHVPPTETSKAWDEPRPREDEGLRYPSNQGETIHTISEKTLMREKLIILTRRLDEMEMKNQHNIYSVNELSASQPSYYNHQSPQSQQPPPLSPVEQAVLNLSKMIGTIHEDQKVLNNQTKQKIAAFESSVNRNLSNIHAVISRLSNQFVHPEEENLEEESQEEECLTETVLVEQVQLQPQEELKEESLEAPEELQDAPESSVNFWPWTKEEEITALLTEKSSGHEGTQEPIIDLETTANAKTTYNPLPVYILPTPAENPKPAAPAPKDKSNPPLYAMQNIKRLVASVHAFATTSKTMATAYIAWHSGWFWCGFGFGAPGPRHF